MEKQILVKLPSLILQLYHQKKFLLIHLQQKNQPQLLQMQLLDVFIQNLMFKIIQIIQNAWMDGDTFQLR